MPDADDRKLVLILESLPVAIVLLTLAQKLIHNSNDTKMQQTKGILQALGGIFGNIVVCLEKIANLKIEIPTPVDVDLNNILTFMGRVRDWRNLITHSHIEDRDAFARIVHEDLTKMIEMLEKLREILQQTYRNAAIDRALKGIPATSQSDLDKLKGDYKQKLDELRAWWNQHATILAPFTLDIPENFNQLRHDIKKEMDNIAKLRDPLFDKNQLREWHHLTEVWQGNKKEEIRFRTLTEAEEKLNRIEKLLKDLENREKACKTELIKSYSSSPISRFLSKSDTEQDIRNKEVAQLPAYCNKQATEIRGKSHPFPQTHYTTEELRKKMHDVCIIQ